jgi:cardiolipin synthase
VSLAVLAQLFLLALLVIELKHNSVFIYLLLEVVGLIEVLVLVDKNNNSSYTIAWLIIILILPVFGYLLYVLWGRTGTHGRKSRKNQEIILRGMKWLKKDPNVQSEFQRCHPSRKRITGYLEQEGFPLYKDTKSKYYGLGELQFEDMIADLEKAKRFIFLEYFILGEGQLWERIHGILKRKAAQGVEVRLMYDDLGSIVTAPNKLIKKLESEHIRAISFNPVHKYISRLYINYRNHQKIAVIDGNIGYTGGTNLADEYANLYAKHGHWKDAAIRLEGDAVWSLTVTFLQMWEIESGIKEDYINYQPAIKITGDGFYQPFSDGPVNNPHNPAEAMYRQLISNAKEYVYITTPYLVIDDLMIDVLCTAAMGGTDVRIITPKIWDHWYVHMVTRSNYGRLMETGVRIYEYTPGYIHAKIIISDDDHAITGSINMDYRSFNLHFEDGVWICGAPVLKDIKKDITDTFEVCEEIALNEWKRRPWYIKILQAFLRLFAPLF